MAVDAKAIRIAAGHNVDAPFNQRGRGEEAVLPDAINVSAVREVKEATSVLQHRFDKSLDDLQSCLPIPLICETMSVVLAAACANI